jgi:hypothetical protein
MADKPYGPPTQTEALANQVGEATGVPVSSASGNGFKLRIPSKPRDLLLRVMNAGSGGCDEPYSRLSVDGKQALTRTGQPSTDPAQIHVNIGEGSFDDIMSIINGMRR